MGSRSNDERRRKGRGSPAEHPGPHSLRAESPTADAGAIRADVRHYPRPNRRDGKPNRRLGEIHRRPDAAGGCGGERPPINNAKLTLAVHHNTLLNTEAVAVAIREQPR